MFTFSEFPSILFFKCFALQKQIQHLVLNKELLAYEHTELWVFSKVNIFYPIKFPFYVPLDINMRPQIGFDLTLEFCFHFFFTV